MVRKLARSSVCCTKPCASTVFTVSVTARPGTAAPFFSAAVDRARDQRLAREGAGGVMHQHDVGLRAAASASSPARTEVCRVAPPKAGGERSSACGRLVEGARGPRA